MLIGSAIWATSARAQLTLTGAGKAGAGGAPSFPPQVSGTNATIAADFAGSQYWASAASQASFAAWLTAIGGTYSRASSATYLQGGVVKTATANTPRFPTDLGGTPQGIRLTGAGTNLVTQSQFVSGWTANNVILTGNAVLSPDGTSSAATAIPDTANSVKFFYNISTVTSGVIYTFSVFVKAAGYNYVTLDPFLMGGVNGALFFLSGSGSVLQFGGYTSATIIQLANGWYRISTTGTVASTSSFNAIYVAPTSSPNAPSTPYVGDGVSGIQAYGAQLEAQSFTSDYIPTTTVTVTQAADTFSFPYTQTTFSTLAYTQGLASVAFDVAVGTNADGPILVFDATHFASYNASVSTLTGNPISGNVSGSHKNMVSGNPSSRTIVSDGGSPATSANGLVGTTPTTMFLGSLAGANYLNGNLGQFAIWNGLVASTAEMQRLTT
jgi:hypothetical protein